MDELKQFGGLTYGTVRPQFVGQPVEDIRESQRILQERSDINKAKLLDLRKTYGELVNKVDTSELGYLNKFDENLKKDIDERINNGEYEYIGTALSNHVGKLLSDVGLQKRIERKQQFDAAQNAINASDWSWKDKVTMKSMEEFQYKPISEEEDATMTYDDSKGQYRVPPNQADVAKKFNMYLTNLKPNSIMRGATHFIKAGADGSDGYSSDELTTDFSLSDKTGIVIDYNSKFVSNENQSRDRLINFFKSIADERVDPEIHNFLKFKYELANRKPGETSEEFNNRLESQGFDKFVTDAFSGLANTLAYSQNATDSTLRHISSLTPRAKTSADEYVSSVTTYDKGRTMDVPSGGTTKEAANITAETKDNANRRLLDNQINLGIPQDRVQDIDQINTRLSKGEGLKNIIPEATEDRLADMAITVEDQRLRSSVADTRMANATEYALREIAKEKNLTAQDTSEIRNELEALKDPTIYDSAIKNLIQAGDPYNILDSEAWTPIIGKLVNLTRKDISGKFRDKVEDWYENNSEITIDSPIDSQVPIFQTEELKTLKGNMENLIGDPGFFSNKDVIINAGGIDEEDFIEARAAGNEAKNINLVGYTQVPFNGQRHWIVNMDFDDDGKSDTKSKQLSILIPFNQLETEASSKGILNNPLIKAMDVLNIPLYNKLDEFEPYEGVKIRRTGTGKALVSLEIDGKLYTTPRDMAVELAKVIAKHQSEIINGKTVENGEEE